ncbi:uncharacterized protein EV420DRAFT_1684260 [Desarmillaria tabescens]|uniref:Transmembrane protein n=1 Tax=Armillaria tabescens TaxID=1929756 RepID=A0AA39T6H0_ARMTA|nr:uncharacterized protein EV420DRAFT_1684260 [Desarmillaria tabescens]KAK0467756.1 hypothetical protein EV420DRAFT_1684260 [Desarmillaria tabescens]
MSGTVINKCWRIQQVLVIVIILLYALTTINVAATLSFLCSGFIENGQSFWTIYSKFIGVNQATYLETVSKVIDVHHEYFSGSNSVVFMTLYMSFILATTLWCTLVIIFHVLTVAGVRCGAGGRLRVYHHFIEVLVESSALYSIALLLDLAFFIHDDLKTYYFNVIAVIARGVAPTLLVGRVAAGHTHPTEEHDKSVTVSTLRFQMASQLSQPSQPSTSSFQESTMQSAVLEADIEAQTERSDELMVVVERMQ